MIVMAAMVVLVALFVVMLGHEYHHTITPRIPSLPLLVMFVVVGGGRW